MPRHGLASTVALQHSKKQLEQQARLATDPLRFLVFHFERKAAKGDGIHFAVIGRRLSMVLKMLLSEHDVRTTTDR